MKIDIRIPIGALFTLIGALLVMQGLLVEAPVQRAATGLNVNAGWGTVLMVFGVGMLLGARRTAALRKRAG